MHFFHTVFKCPSHVPDHCWIQVQNFFITSSTISLFIALISWTKLWSKGSRVWCSFLKTLAANIHIKKDQCWLNLVTLVYRQGYIFLKSAMNNSPEWLVAPSCWNHNTLFSAPINFSSEIAKFWSISEYRWEGSHCSVIFFEKILT